MIIVTLVLILLVKKVTAHVFYKVVFVTSVYVLMFCTVYHVYTS